MGEMTSLCPQVLKYISVSSLLSSGAGVGGALVGFGSGQAVALDSVPK